MSTFRRYSLAQHLDRLVDAYGGGSPILNLPQVQFELAMFLDAKESQVTLPPLLNQFLTNHKIGSVENIAKSTRELVEFYGRLPIE